MPSSFFDSIDDLPVTSHIPEMDRLLSATSYPHAPSNTSAGDRTREQLYGGIIPTASSEDDENARRPSKRSRPDLSKQGENSQEAPRRQRGRPKVSTKDETAAERRRTQIRLAQRAYRNRKENTITDLSQKVENLQTTIKSLNTDFAQLRDTMLSSGVIPANPNISRQVDDLMQKMSDALEPLPSDGEQSSEGNESEPINQGAMQDQNQYVMSERQTVPMALQGQIHSASSRPVVDITGAPLGIGTVHDMVGLEGQYLTDFQSQPALPMHYPTFNASNAGPSQFPNPQTLPSSQLALTSVDRFPHKQSYTYSFQETTFARRLHRLCIERVFQKLMGSYVNTDWMLRTFRFTFHFTNRQRLTQTFRNLLARGINDPLEDVPSPFLFIGGAGSHFPRVNANGQAEYPPNMMTPFQMSAPWRIPDVLTPPRSASLEDILESIGFGGEWFDCHDVEGYLRSKGVYPDVRSSFAVVDTGINGPAAPRDADVVDTVTSSSSPHSHDPGQIFESYAPREGLTDNATMDINQLLTNTGTNPNIDYSIDNWLGQQEDFHTAQINVNPEQPVFEAASRETRMLTIELERFLEKLADESVCLGRAPGFRKQTVDDALAHAMQEAF